MQLLVCDKCDGRFLVKEGSIETCPFCQGKSFTEIEANEENIESYKALKREVELEYLQMMDNKVKIDLTAKEIKDPRIQAKKARRRKLRLFWERFKPLIISLLWAGVISLYRWQLGVIAGSFLVGVWAWCEIDFYFFRKRLGRKDD